MTSGPDDEQATIARLRSKHPARKGVVFNVLVTVVEVGGAILLFRLARGAGASDLVAYLVGAIAPIIGGLAVWVRSRRLNGASAAILAFALLSALIAFVGSTAPKMLLYKDCVLTALIGLIFLGSCVLAKPVMFYFSQRYGTDGTAEGMHVFDLMWADYPRFRHGIYAMSFVWAGVYLAQAAITAVIISRNTFDAAYTWNQILPFVATVIAVAATVRIARWMRSAGEDLAAA
ncbi:VC0807 family protein [Gordonia sp. ABSL49_1]|uniref:VC0807 family protein n=1 Tax=Gordonia sp. ABSL49_1 TaxID=2920941 RepID=UPI001F0F56E5|nr:VC0807 family protein [Gordonia sp. ABSL49_1]MCH5644628.1 hypothetical protein [Gordonia sp. ABSL49_1]